MTLKQPIRQSEAKILIYLSVVHDTRKHVTAIHSKLGMDYSYLLQQLQGMIAKGWLIKHKSGRHTFYTISSLAPLELAKNSLISQDLQKDLEANYTQEELVVQPGVKNDTEDQVRE